jgi:hypothetical protein
MIEVDAVSIAKVMLTLDTYGWDFMAGALIFLAF